LIQDTRQFYLDIIETSKHLNIELWLSSMIPPINTDGKAKAPLEVVVFGQSLSPNREGGWGFLTGKQVKNRLSNHLGIIVFVTARQVGTFSERNR